MDYSIYILKIIMFFIMIFVFYLVIHNKNKLSVGRIIFCSILFSIYSIIITKYPFILDKKIYALKFSADLYESQVFNDSIGLWGIQKILHIFTYNPNVLFFVISFIYIFITLMAYNEYEEKHSGMFILLLSLSGYFLYGFYLIKQCIAVSLIALAVSLFMKKKYKKTIILVFLASLFHETALIMIPVFILFKFINHKYIRTIIYILLFIILFAFPIINTSIIKLLIYFFPSLEFHLRTYLSGTSIVLSSNVLTIFKGVPFYLISLYGIFNRKRLLTKIKNYNLFLFCSLFSSFSILFSYYMYWMYRFGIYFYVPTLIFASNIIYNIKNSKNRSGFIFVVLVSMLILIIKDLVQYYFNYGGI